MLYWLTKWFYAHFHAFRVFQYLTFRSILAALTSLLVAFIIGPKMIRWLTRMQIGQSVRDDGPKSHLGKAGTPTMGGALILFAVGVSSLLWTNLTNHYFWLAFFTTMSFGLIGWIDDYKKLVLKNAKGLSAKQKYFWQSVVGFGVAFFLYFSSPSHSELLLPFFKNTYIELGWFFPILTYLVIVGSSNAVNLTDGLDGLATLPTVMIAGALGIFAYATSNSIYAHYLALPYLPEAGELTVYCSAMVGAGLGFLWFNAYPAQVFMGDVGSLALGAALGILAVLVRQELVLLVMGGLFVAETLSVILQVGYFKYSGGKRIFLMAPLHHHFELKGWPEPKVTVRFWIITVILVLMGLSTLKLR